MKKIDLAKKKKIDLANKWADKMLTIAEWALMTEPVDRTEFISEVTAYLYDELKEIEED